MTLTIDYKSAQVTKLDASPRQNLQTTESRGRVRYFKGYYKNETGSTIAANSIIALALIDAPGVILPTSVVYVTAFGSSRTMDVGLQSYTATDGTAVTDDVDALKDGTDVSAATSFSLNENTQGISLSGPAQVVAKVLGGTMPANAEIIAHIYVVMD